MPDLNNDTWDWVGIEHDYVHGDKSLDRISAAYGISAWRLRKHAQERGLVRLVGTKPLRTGPKPRALGARPRPKRPTAAERRRRQMVARLLDALDKGLTDLEARMTSGSEARAERSAADAERDARTLAGLTRLYARLVQLDTQVNGAKGAEKQGSGHKEATEDADRFRGELALRLQRLNQARDT